MTRATCRASGFTLTELAVVLVLPERDFTPDPRDANVEPPIPDIATFFDEPPVTFGPGCTGARS